MSGAAVAGTFTGGDGCNAKVGESLKTDVCWFSSPVFSSVVVPLPLVGASVGDIMGDLDGVRRLPPLKLPSTLE